MTPTYNRSKTLPQLYKSLIKNNKYCDSFEWLIMDDGSTDKTREILREYQRKYPDIIKSDAVCSSAVAK